MIAEAFLGDVGILLTRLMQEISHAQRALMFRDEIRNRARKPMSSCQFQPFIYMGLEHSCTG